MRQGWSCSHYGTETQICNLKVPKQQSPKVPKNIAEIPGSNFGPRDHTPHSLAPLYKLLVMRCIQFSSWKGTRNKLYILGSPYPKGTRTQCPFHFTSTFLAASQEPGSKWTWERNCFLYVEMWVSREWKYKPHYGRKCLQKT